MFLFGYTILSFKYVSNSSGSFTKLACLDFANSICFLNLWPFVHKIPGIERHCNKEKLLIILRTKQVSNIIFMISILIPYWA